MAILTLVVNVNNNVNNNNNNVNGANVNTASNNNANANSNNNNANVVNVMPPGKKRKRREFNPLDEYTNKICSRARAETGINLVQSRGRNRYKSGPEQEQKQV
ncbi:AN1-type zinc finger and UBX domain-containing protein DDB_G0268260-like [Eurytemora carolleeae]|uniref:AN1-type zinc finger and UBX domain-containing protein DDB_G0268260-like n=1 Tax=Eurytemora carolleeae TaxID=1294199 RepID=UPI000C770463|nr:AN1-type zinc finger and UBX domain-containing protein DDB_G0268260-like [Eurytemora carolleeae]|eukprot:XP_023348508.1 AN1-type zinc finger and UBX domain-containing protein DDB_G0268260-like [Eurytemora affinis]